ncbi:MAG: 2OG-Fe(II) oxygenase [Hyphomicrobiaceae bacterium]
MTYPRLPAPEAVAAHFLRSLRQSRREDKPYLHWKMRDVLPEDMCTGLLTLPIAPPVIADRDGTRDTYNDSRAFFTPQLRSDFPACAVLCEALQRPDVAVALGETFGIRPKGGFLRIEYIQDTDGAWLEPHRDIPDKMFSMVVYLCTGPEAKNWGTDIYDDDRRWIGRAAADFNTAVTFIAGPNTWHGFDKRPIRGVRRLLEINYVKNWRDKGQLAYPDRPIGVA